MYCMFYTIELKLNLRIKPWMPSNSQQLNILHAK